MLLIEGKRVQMKFYEDFLEKLNGTADMLQALLGVGFAFSQHYLWFF